MGIIRYTLTLIAVVATTISAFALPKGSASGKDKNFIVVIDAGHGGKDTGAIDNNVREKDINLGVALKLGEMIQEKMKDVTVVYTRDTDRYLTLQERADKANKSKGDLFISIHTNSVDKSNKNRTSVAGASVYALGLHKDGNNMAVARRENSVIELEKDFEQKYSGFDPAKDESYIIFEMAQKKNLSRSLKFAAEVQKQLVSTASRRDRGVHQAGFWVLWATSMPAVLVELDFICNPNSAKYMSSQKGSSQLAEAIYNAVKTYKNQVHTTGRGGRAAIDTPSAAEPDNNAVILSAAPKKENRQRREVTSTATSRKQATASKQRRRRSAAAKAVSSECVATVDNIPLGHIEAPASASEKENTAVASAAKKETSVSDSKQTSRRHSGHKKPRSGRHAKAGHVTTVYKIQILASEEKLKQNNPRFHGLSPIKSFRERNLYKYTYGETEDRAEIDRLLAEVRQSIPDAFIIKSVVSTN